MGSPPSPLLLATSILVMQNTSPVCFPCLLFHLYPAKVYSACGVQTSRQEMIEDLEERATVSDIYSIVGPPQAHLVFCIARLEDVHGLPEVC